MKQVAILGFGTVGRATYDILCARREKLSRLFGEEVRVGKVLVRPHRLGELPNGVGVTTMDEILEDEGIEIVVELTGAKEEARHYILSALKAKKHVVTANKAVVCAHYREFLDAAKEHGVHILFEAAVGGGIPILSPLRNLAATNSITAIDGIMNGTCNYLLWSMTTKGTDFDNTLKTCQELGYAEADPTDDVEGYDTARKLKILLSMATGSDISPEFPVRGIRDVLPEDIAFLKERGYVLKLLGKGRITEEGVDARVEPTAVSLQNPLSSVDEATNAISLLGSSTSRLTMMGPGAGGPPTGNAVVSDIVDLLAGHVVPLAYDHAPLPLKQSEIAESFYLRGHVKDLNLPFTEVQEREGFVQGILSPITNEELLAATRDREIFCAPILP